MNRILKFICFCIFSIFLNSSILFASASKINFIEFDIFKETIQSHIIDNSSLSKINSVDYDFRRANQDQIKIIKKEIGFSNFNEQEFINSYTQLSKDFTQLSFDIYKESKFQLITNGVLTSGLDTKLKRISIDQINQFYGLPSISVSIPMENSKYLPVESGSVTAATAVPTVGLSTLAIATVFGVGAASGGGSGNSGGGSGTCSDPCITLSANKSEIYDSDTSGVTLTATASTTSLNSITVNLQAG